MSKPWPRRTFVDLLGVIYRRRSPERLTYARPLLVWALVLAICAALLAHLMLLGLDVPHSLLKVVCELGVFVLGLNLATRGRRVRVERVLKMAFALLLISALGDLVLVGVSQAPPGIVQQLAVGAVVASQLYGGVNCVQFGLSVGWPRAAAVLAAFLAAALVLYEVAVPLMAGLL